MLYNFATQHFYIGLQENMINLLSDSQMYLKYCKMVGVT